MPTLSFRDEGDTIHIDASDDVGNGFLAAVLVSLAARLKVTSKTGCVCKFCGAIEAIAKHGSEIFSENSNVIN
jgi:hypothetical protein